jgi:hypothetical protein
MAGGSDDASMGSPPADGGGDATMEPTAPCDAALVLPEGTAKGGACGDCLKQNCMAALTTCQSDCVCVSAEECLVVNNDSFTICNDALSAIGAGNPGLTALGACIPAKCMVCNEPPG